MGNEAPMGRVTCGPFPMRTRKMRLCPPQGSARCHIHQAHPDRRRASAFPARRPVEVRLLLTWLIVDIEGPSSTVPGLQCNLGIANIYVSPKSKPFTHETHEARNIWGAADLVRTSVCGPMNASLASNSSQGQRGRAI